MVNYELPVASLLLAGADYLLLTADCLVRLRGGELVELLAHTADYDKMSSRSTKEQSIVTLENDGPMQECL
jgi:hypothetical protein